MIPARSTQMVPPALIGTPHATAGGGGAGGCELFLLDGCCCCCSTRPPLDSFVGVTVETPYCMATPSTLPVPNSMGPHRVGIKKSKGGENHNHNHHTPPTHGSIQCLLVVVRDRHWMNQQQPETMPRDNTAVR